MGELLLLQSLHGCFLAASAGPWTLAAPQQELSSEAPLHPRLPPPQGRFLAASRCSQPAGTDQKHRWKVNCTQQLQMFTLSLLSLSLSSSMAISHNMLVFHWHLPCCCHLGHFRLPQPSVITCWSATGSYPVAASFFTFFSYHWQLPCHCHLGHFHLPQPSVITCWSATGSYPVAASFFTFFSYHWQLPCHCHLGHFHLPQPSVITCWSATGSYPVAASFFTFFSYHWQLPCHCHLGHFHLPQPSVITCWSATGSYPVAASFFTCFFHNHQLWHASLQSFFTQHSKAKVNAHSMHTTAASLP